MSGDFCGFLIPQIEANLSITSQANRGKLASLIYMVDLLRFGCVREAFKKAFGNKELGANNSYE
jgi:hypothetical protein